jgi:hypothetical protein
MSEELKENSEVKVEVSGFLSKFEGEPLPENEFERLEIQDGQVVAIHQIENGEVVSSEYREGGEVTQAD